MYLATQDIVTSTLDLARPSTWHCILYIFDSHFQKKVFYIDSYTYQHCTSSYIPACHYIYRNRFLLSINHLMIQFFPQQYTLSYIQHVPPSQVVLSHSTHSSGQGQTWWDKHT